MIEHRGHLKESLTRCLHPNRALLRTIQGEGSTHSDCKGMKTELPGGNDLDHE